MDLARLAEVGWCLQKYGLGLNKFYNYLQIQRMQPRTSSAPFCSALLVVLISALLTAGSASPHVHFNTKDLQNQFNKQKEELDRAIAWIHQNCNTSQYGPCLADILKILEQEGGSGITKDDNTSSQQASALGQNSQNNEGTAPTQSQCQIIISKAKALVKQIAVLKHQLKVAEQNISQQDQKIISLNNGLAICSSLLKECQDRVCPPCPHCDDCEKCEELRSTKIALNLSQIENVALKSKILEYEESLNSWNKLLNSTLQQVGSEVLSLQEFSTVTKINVTALATSLGNLLTLANTPSDNFLQTSQNYQNQASSLTDSFVKFIQSTFSFASSSLQAKMKCQDLFKDYKSAVQSLKECNDILKGSK